MSQPVLAFLSESEAAPGQTYLVFIAPGRDERHWVFLHPVTSTQTTQEVVEGLKNFLKSPAFSKSPAKSLGFFPRLFVKMTLDVANLAWYGRADEVLVSGSIPSQELTSALNRPGLRRGDRRPFILAHPGLALGSPAGQALVLRYHWRKGAIAVAIITSLMVWLLAGASAGVGWRSFAIGVAIAGIGVGVMSLLLGMIAWLFA